MRYENVAIEIGGKYAPSKKAIKEAVRDRPEDVRVLATGIAGPDFMGPVAEMPEDIVLSFTGPNPYTNRQFYGNIERRGQNITVK